MAEVTGKRRYYLTEIEALVQSVLHSPAAEPSLQRHGIVADHLAPDVYQSRLRQWVEAQKRHRPELYLRDRGAAMLHRNAQKPKDSKPRPAEPLGPEVRGDDFAAFAERQRVYLQTIANPERQARLQVNLEEMLARMEPFARRHPVLWRHPLLALELAMGLAGRVEGEAQSVLDPERIEVVEQILPHGYVWYVGYRNAPGEAGAPILTQELVQDKQARFEPSGRWKTTDAPSPEDWLRLQPDWRPQMEARTTVLYPAKRPLLIYAQLHREPERRDYKERREMPGGIILPRDSDGKRVRRLDMSHLLAFSHGGANDPELNLALEDSDVNQLHTEEVDWLLRYWMMGINGKAGHGVEMMISLVWRHGRSEEAASLMTGYEENISTYGVAHDLLPLMKHVAVRPLGSERAFMSFVLVNTPLKERQYRRMIDHYPRLRLWHEDAPVTMDYTRVMDEALRLGVEPGPPDAAVFDRRFLRYANKPVALEEAKILVEVTQPSGEIMLTVAPQHKALEIYEQYRRQGMPTEAMFDPALPVRFLGQADLASVVEQFGRWREDLREEKGDAYHLNLRLIPKTKASQLYPSWRSGKPVRMTAGLDRFQWAALAGYGAEWDMDSPLSGEFPCWRFATDRLYAHQARVVMVLTDPAEGVSLVTLPPGDAARYYENLKRQEFTAEEMTSPRLALRYLREDEGPELLEALSRQAPVPSYHKGEKVAAAYDIPPFKPASLFPAWRWDMPIVIPEGMSAVEWSSLAVRSITPVREGFLYQPVPGKVSGLLVWARSARHPDHIRLAAMPVAEALELPKFTPLKPDIEIMPVQHAHGRILTQWMQQREDQAVDVIPPKKGRKQALAELAKSLRQEPDSLLSSLMGEKRRVERQEERQRVREGG